ncbi:LOW QUALITY PROTEIN: BAHD acyltransferase BIA1 [Pyrus x bretschneideri]|uniref:LOW QUALITY PROTEIN: BAHD acyltransferase BIA1 n=1 Tax=Pyrus x bretschneideri TaxID=225117 RepID=UPI00202F51EB|nr:LOW QUALITY PROTEIN: BAHD acyltransferase BIA1 [Pyrus x bretschneideri]
MRQYYNGDLDLRRYMEGPVMIVKVEEWRKTMASEKIKVEITHKETIKPSSPTPRHLSSTDLSVFDQFTPEIYVPLLLFYPSSSDEEVNNIDHHSLFAERSNLLKTSLSEALTRFYPFAGEFVYNVSIRCNDHGAGFHEAQVNCSLSKILENPDLGILKLFVPTAVESKQAEAGHLLLVQVNLFKCGGMAIGVSISHKVADASTLSTFIKSWTEIALGSGITTVPAVLPAEFRVAATLFPPQDFFSSSKPIVEFAENKCVTKRFVFDAAKIAALKSKAASITLPNPTRVEVVSALIWKCATEASRSNLGFVKPSVLLQVLNMRKRSGQAMTENILGNFLWYFTTTTMESELDLESLVGKLRKGIEEYKEKYSNGLSSEVIFQSLKESGNLLLKDSTENYTCTSWCRFPFYEANFGWGKPSWVSTHGSELKNKILLMDMSDGVGIEATLTLKEEDMAIIESNKELLAYASVNSTVI